MAPRNSSNKLTTPKTFRITHTQKYLLSLTRYKINSSALVRVLLDFFFNKKLPLPLLEEIELKLKEEIERSKKAEISSYFEKKGGI
jgi:hypothetical protein